MATFESKSTNNVELEHRKNTIIYFNSTLIIFDTVCKQHFSAVVGSGALN